MLPEFKAEVLRIIGGWLSSCYFAHFAMLDCDRKK